MLKNNRTSMLKIVTNGFLFVALVANYGCVSMSGGFVENDALAGILKDTEDRNLTQTTAVQWLETESTSLPSRGLGLATDLAAFVIKPYRECRSERERETKSASIPTDIEIGITAFTPKNLETTETVPNERPYASLTYLSASNTVVCKEDSDVIGPRKTIAAFSLTFNLALLGLSFGEDAQRGLHITGGTSSRRPNGWGHQISEDIEPTLRYSFEWNRLLMDVKRTQLSAALGVSLGYYTNLSVGSDIRFLLKNGNSEKKFTTEFYDLGGARISPGTEAPPIQDRFLFVGFRTRLIGYNALMQGGFRRPANRVSSANVENVVSTYTLGLSDSISGWCQMLALNDVWSFAGNKIHWLAKLSSGIENACTGMTFAPTRMTFAAHQRTPEFKSAAKPREHVWAGLYFSRRF